MLKTEKREITLGACERQMGKSNASGRGRAQKEKRAEANSKGGGWWCWGGRSCPPGVFKISHDGCHVLEITAG